MLENVDKYVDKCSKLWISGFPSFRGKSISVGARVVRRGETTEKPGQGQAP